MEFSPYILLLSQIIGTTFYWANQRLFTTNLNHRHFFSPNKFQCTFHQMNSSSPSTNTEEYLSPALLTSLSSSSDWWCNQKTQLLPQFPLPRRPKPVILPAESDDSITTLRPNIPSYISFDHTSLISPLSTKMGGGMEDAARMSMEKSGSSSNPSTPARTKATTTAQSASKVASPTARRPGSPFNINHDEMKSVIEKSNATYMMEMEQRMNKKNQQFQAQMMDEFKILLQQVAKATLPQQTAQATSTPNPPVQQVQVSDTTTTSGTPRNESTTNGAASNCDTSTHAHSSANNEDEDVSTVPDGESRWTNYDGENSIPVTGKMEPLHKGPVLHINANSYTKFIKPLLGEDDTIEAYHVAECYVRATKYIAPEIDLDVISARELPTIDHEGSDTRLAVQFVVKIRHPEDMANNSHEAQVRKLRDVAHRTIASKIHHELVYDDLPKYLPAFNFLLPPVNAPDYLPCAVLYGNLPAWMDLKDYKAKDLLLEEIIRAIPADENSNYDTSVWDPVRLWRSVGISHYSSSQAKIDRKFGQILALYYAKTDEGEDTARFIIDAFGDSVFNIFGDLAVSFRVFPKRAENSRSRRPTKNAVTSFAQETIKGNHEYCKKKYQWFTIDGVTEAVFDPAVANDIVCSVENAVAVIPHSAKGWISKTTRQKTYF